MIAEADQANTLDQFLTESLSQVLAFDEPLFVPEDLESALDEIEPGAVKWAWEQGSRVDRSGGIWLKRQNLAAAIGIDGLGDLAEFFLLVSGRSDRGIYEEETYFRGERIRDLARSSENEALQRNSKECFRALHDSRAVASRRNSWEEQKRNHGRERKNQALFRPFDELTGDAFLLYELLEFVPIRIPCFYTSLTDSPWNGVMVCEETREKILDFGVADEIDLFALCQFEDWSMDWVFSFSPNLEFLLPNEVVASLPRPLSMATPVHTR